ncbi:MAG TPA: protein-disulfide reductase DsbD domain-containing protein [Cytophagaceae bacterium]
MKKNLLVLFLSLIALTVSAQIQRPAKWRFELSKKEVKVGETIELIFYVDIDENWYMYSSDFEMEAGPMPATFDFAPHNSYKLVGGIKAVGAKKKYDEIFEGEYTYFNKKAEFRQKVKILKPDPQITVTYNYQVCSDKSGQCIPFEDEYTFTGIKVTTSVEPSKQTTPDESIKVKSPEKATDSESTSQTITIKQDDRYYSQRITELEKEKAKLITYDTNGEDESIKYLKDFVNKYGKK